MQKLELSIPEPCHESWDKMTSTEKGRFCNACAKEVVDFSVMTDTEILHYFSKLTNEKVCGRLLPDQMNKAIIASVQPKKNKFRYWHYITAIFLFFTKSETKAQTKASTTQNPINSNYEKGKIAAQVVKQNVEKEISGKVIGADGKPLSYAFIKIKNRNVETRTDKNGIYSIKVNTEKDILQVYSQGYAQKEFVIKGLEKYDFQLTQRAPIVLGGAIGYKKS